jgi:hypothetical protein
MLGAPGKQQVQPGGPLNQGHEDGRRGQALLTQASGQGSRQGADRRR